MSDGTRDLIGGPAGAAHQSTPRPATADAPATGSAAGGPVVVADRLHKRYRRHVAVHDLSFALHPGQVVGLLGPNGAGKTTTMKMLTGLVTPTAGTATVCGEPAGAVAARRHLGYLPEQFRFPDWMTGTQVLRLHGELAGIDLGPDELAAALDRVGLAGRGDDRIAGYSKGMQQRLGVAQALLGSPRAVLLDEPTSALDPLGRRLVRDLIVELARSGVGVLLNSHLLSEVEMVCDTVVIVDRGRVVHSGVLDDLAAPTIEVRIQLDRVDDDALGIVAARGHLGASDDRSLIATVREPDDVAALAADLVRAGYRLRALVPVRRTLEDLFVGLVQESGQ